MAILCSPVSSQLDGGEGHREVHARSALRVAARCGRERFQGAGCTRWANWRSGARGGAACARRLEALEARPMRSMRSLSAATSRRAIPHASRPYYARTVGLSSVGAEHVKLQSTYSVLAQRGDTSHGS